MKLEIVSPKGSVFDGEADSVLFPGLMGDFMILPNHAPLLAVLSKGAITILIKEAYSERTKNSI